MSGQLPDWIVRARSVCVEAIQQCIITKKTAALVAVGGNYTKTDFFAEKKSKKVVYFMFTHKNIIESV